MVEVAGETIKMAGDIEWGLSISKYGYTIMERNDTTGDYVGTFYFLNEETLEVEAYENRTITIPKGPRVGSSDESETDGSEEATEETPTEASEETPTEASTSGPSHNFWYSRSIDWSSCLVLYILSFIAYGSLFD